MSNLIWYGRDWIRFSRVSGLINSWQVSQWPEDIPDSWSKVLTFPPWLWKFLTDFQWAIGQSCLGVISLWFRTEKNCLRSDFECLWPCELVLCPATKLNATCFQNLLSVTFLVSLVLFISSGRNKDRMFSWFYFDLSVWFGGNTCSSDTPEADIVPQTMNFGANLEFWMGSTFDLFLAQTRSFLQVPGTDRYIRPSSVNVIILKSSNCPLLSLLEKRKSFAVWFLEILRKTGLLHE